MERKPRIGLWFGHGLENVLAARAALGQLQAEHPGADWVLFGPRESLFVFEMDGRVPVYIPLRSLEPRRAAQSHLSYYLEKRAQFKKLQGLGLNECRGVVVFSADERVDKVLLKSFQKDLSRLGVHGDCLVNELKWFLGLERPTLQAGPEALAFATQYHRKSPPNLPKYLVLLSEYSAPGFNLDQQWSQVQTFDAFQQKSHVTVAVITKGSRLTTRRLTQSHPDWLQLNWAQAMGLIAYADGVISSSADVTLICQEMGRSDLLLLDKSHS